MTNATETRSGKTHRDENFPVAVLVEPRLRPAILAFYRFVRAADDVADHPNLGAQQKLALLDGLADALNGRGSDPEAEPLRLALLDVGMEPTHALELIEAFRLDARKNRYANWSELMDYCRLSAAPVGRFVLDAHKENRALWPASDALCGALQVLNHLQDCGADYRRLDRVYMPLDIFNAHGATVEMLGEERAPPPLRAALADIAREAERLVDSGELLAPQVANRRLRLEVAVISRLARRLAERLLKRDPLCERVHFSRPEAAWISATALMAAARPSFGFRRRDERVRA